MPVLADWYTFLKENTSSEKNIVQMNFEKGY